MARIDSVVGKAKAIVLLPTLLVPAPTGAQEALCEGQAKSRWSTGGGAYHRTAVYGQDNDRWLKGLTGLAATAERVFVYDGQTARIHVLDSFLRPLHQFGRRGGGPGELSLTVVDVDPYRYLTGNYLTADDSLVAVYDGRSIQTYRHDGRYIDKVATVAGRPKYTVMKLQTTPRGLFYSYDRLDTRGTGRRDLQTWRVTGEQPALVASVPAHAPPTLNGVYSGWSRDPHPLWSMYGPCVIWADGLAHQVIRSRVAQPRADTVRLPAHRVPPSERDEDMARRLARRMGAPDPPPIPRNSPLWHWSSLVTDPDGHIWVRPWSRSSPLDVPVYRIDVYGNPHAERLPAFPMAFGAPGVFYARDIDPATDEVLVVRYEWRASNERDPR